MYTLIHPCCLNLDFRWDYIQEGTNVKQDMNRLIAFWMGLMTWSKWVDANVDPKVTRVFFQGISPTHYL